MSSSPEAVFRADCGIDPGRAARLLERERAQFVARRPRSAALTAAAMERLLFGVPLHWMRDWGTPIALHVAEAAGARLVDVDGHVLVDFCLGDTGAMFGHTPAAVCRALAHQAARGMTAMLPGEDAAAVGRLLGERFGLARWQFSTTASDANRFVLRWLRAATGRSRILVFNGCYHGTVDDTFVDLIDGHPQQRASLLGQVQDLTAHTVVVEFNDLEALADALARCDIAAVLAEPAMTNVGMVLPDAEFWPQAQALIRASGAALVFDETHTLSCGPGGYGQAAGITPDALVLGKAIGGGFPCAVYGFSEEWAERVMRAKLAAAPGHSGIGTTLSGSLLAMAAIRATLEQLLLPAVFAPMIARAQDLAAGLRATIARQGLPWCVSVLGARSEFQFSAHPPRNGSAARAAQDDQLGHLIHLALLNRGVLITPFHNMMLVCPDTSAGDCTALCGAFAQVIDELLR